MEYECTDCGEVFYLSKEQYNELDADHELTCPACGSEECSPFDL